MTTLIKMLATDFGEGQLSGLRGRWVLYNRVLSRTRLIPLFAVRPACIVAIQNRKAKT